jgi:hypothetical protein
MVAINAAICRAAGFPVAHPAEFDLTECNFPPEMFKLRLGSLLRLILFVGSIREKDRLRRKQRPFAATDIGAATENWQGSSYCPQRLAETPPRNSEEHAPTGNRESGRS